MYTDIDTCHETVRVLEWHHALGPSRIVYRDHTCVLYLAHVTCAQGEIWPPNGPKISMGLVPKNNTLIVAAVRRTAILTGGRIVNATRSVWERIRHFRVASPSCLCSHLDPQHVTVTH